MIFKKTKKKIKIKYINPLKIDMKINLTWPNSKVSGVNLMKPSISSAEKLHHIYLAGLKTDLC